MSLQIKNEFLSLWDGLDSDANSGVLVMGTTNGISRLDEAAQRRFTLCKQVGVDGTTVAVHVVKQKHHGFQTCTSSGSIRALPPSPHVSANRRRDVVAAPALPYGACCCPPCIRSPRPCLPACPPAQVPLPTRFQRRAILAGYICKHAVAVPQQGVEPQLLREVEQVMAEQQAAAAGGDEGEAAEDESEDLRSAGSSSGSSVPPTTAASAKSAPDCGAAAVSTIGDVGSPGGGCQQENPPTGSQRPQAKCLSARDSDEANAAGAIVGVLDKLAAQTEGFSGDELHKLCCRAVKHCQQGGQEG